MTENIARVDMLVSLLKVATRIARPMRDGVADPEQISATELRIMLALGGEGELAGHELAELMAMQPMNVSRALASLLGMGLIEKVDNTLNRRRKPYRLSTAGAEKFGAMWDRMDEVAGFVFAGLSSAEQKRAATLFSRLDARLVEWETPADQPHVPRP